MTIPKTVELLNQKGTPKAAYLAGLDCAINGANEENCHFSLFRSPELTKEWERGKRDGERKAKK